MKRNVLISVILILLVLYVFATYKIYLETEIVWGYICTIDFVIIFLIFVKLMIKKSNNDKEKIQ